MNKPGIRPLSHAPELSVVIPAYNEVACIESTVRRWIEACRLLGIVAEVLVVDDGSTDGTETLLRRVADKELRCLRVIRAPHMGHGAAVRRGYSEARGQWIAQVDADDEVGPEPFVKLWLARNNADVTLGIRQGREQTPIRRWVSRGARIITRFVCGRIFDDPNAPYRLASLSALSALLPLLPTGTATPNIVLTWLAVRQGFRVQEIAVPVTRVTWRRELRGLPLLRTVCRGITDTWRVVHIPQARIRYSLYRNSV